MPALSVVTTVLDGEPWLETSLRSILDQTLDDLELIVIDDGSKDRSAEIAGSFGDPRVSVVRHERTRGIGARTNEGLRRARASLVAIQDADDVSLPSRLARQRAFLDEHPDLAACGAHALVIDEHGRETGALTHPARDPHDVAFQAIWSHNPVVHPSAVLRREVILRHGGYDEDPQIRTVVDFELWLRLLARGERVANIPEPLVLYRVHERSQTRSRPHEMQEAHRIVHRRWRGRIRWRRRMAALRAAVGLEPASPHRREPLSFVMRRPPAAEREEA